MHQNTDGAPVPNQPMWFQAVYDGVTFAKDAPGLTVDDILFFYQKLWVGHLEGAKVERIHFEVGERQAVVVFSAPRPFDSETLNALTEYNGQKPTIRPLDMFTPQVAR